MFYLYLIAAGAALLPATCVPLLAPRIARGYAGSRLHDRVQRVHTALVENFGRSGAALATLLGTSGAVITICWPVGYWMAKLQNAVDWPVWRWVHGERNAAWEHLNSAVTLMGERGPLKVVTVVAAVGFAVLWRRRWWIPVLAMPLQFAWEQYAQTILKLVVHRGHPPTDLGTYPSGGIARVAMTFGTILVLAMLTWRIPRRVRIGMCTLLAVATAIEAYTRIYVEKHWLTDVLGGLLFGPLLFGSFALALVVLAATSRPTVTDEPSPARTLEAVR